MNYLEILGTALALAYVFLAILELRWCWLAAILSSLCYIKIFMDAQLFTEAALQILFIAIGVKGFVSWQLSLQPNGEQFDKVMIHRQSVQKHIVGIVGTGIASLILGYVVFKISGVQFAYLDSAITCFSIYATWLAAEKVLESWLYWVVIDLVAAPLYFYKQLSLTAALYSLYVVLAVLGYFKWRKLMMDKYSNE